MNILKFQKENNKESRLQTLLMQYIVADEQFYQKLEIIIRLLALNVLVQSFKVTLLIIVMEFSLCFKGKSSDIENGLDDNNDML